jgi:hypothetical protein
MPLIRHCHSSLVERSPSCEQTERMNHLAAALAYASQGIAVFPLAPRSKQPLIPARSGGHGLHDATADPEVIKRWFQDHPTANIGLTTSVSFDVIDLDGEAAIDALEEARARRAGRDTDSRCPARRRPGYQDQAARHRRTAQACARSRSTSRERPPTTTRHGSGGSAHSRIGATLMRPNRIGLPRQAVAGAGGHPRSLLAVAGDGVGMRGHQPRGPLRVTALEPEYAGDEPSRPVDKDQLRRTHLRPTPGKEQDHDRTSTLRLVHRR